MGIKWGYGCADRGGVSRVKLFDIGRIVVGQTENVMCGKYGKASQGTGLREENNEAGKLSEERGGVSGGLSRWSVMNRGRFLFMG